MTLFIVPSNIAEIKQAWWISSEMTTTLNNTKYYIAENMKSARRFLRKAGFTGNFDALSWHIIDKHSDPVSYISFLQNVNKDQNIVLLSEAGIPGIADPGSDIVRLAHQIDITVKPVTGPSSIFLALAASGLNGQHFAFHGYLPIKERERATKLKQLELEAKKNNITQIFIETPYRNNQMLKTICTTLHADTFVCIAADIEGPHELILTKTVSGWKNNNRNFHKMPAVFLIGS